MIDFDVTARKSAIIIIVTLAFLFPGARGANAAFGIFEWSGNLPANTEGVLQAGGHPDDIVTTVGFNSHLDPATGAELPDAGVRNLTVDLPPGFTGNPTAAGTCDSVQDLIAFGEVSDCPIDSIIGTVDVSVSQKSQGFTVGHLPLYNMKPPAGQPAEFGFQVQGVPQVLTANTRSDRDYAISVKLRNISQGVSALRATTTFWGTPADPSHDEQRCRKYGGGSIDFCPGVPGDPVEGPNSVSTGVTRPFLAIPTSCNEPGEGLRFDVFGESWEQPPGSDETSFTTPLGASGCDRVPFDPHLTVQPTTDEADSPTGLEVNLTVPSDGFNNPGGVSQSHLKDATVSLPQGMTINPSQASGLAVCSPSQIGLISGDSPHVQFNEEPPHCPDASKIGEVQVDTPILEEPLAGSLYLAQQDDQGAPGAENPFDSLLALYIVAEGSGVRVKLAGEVAPDPSTGQVVTRFLNNPQVPFERFSLKFKGGQRAPLATPPTCGMYTTTADLTPWARPDQPVTVSDSFQITKGPNGGPCPIGATSFAPGFVGGTLNNNAGSYSPISVRMTRNDGEQEITSFSAQLPPGLVGKLAGIPYCPDAAIEAAKARAGTQENLNPSCPAASQVGSILAGAGVGSQLVYAPGKVYLAGSYHGDPISIAAITTATVGPFDLGTVVVRSGLKIDPETAQVSVDSTGSDPIPHILDGIVLHIRDIHVHVDRPDFTLNPTNCDPFTFAATLTGSGADFANSQDDVPVGVSNPFQAANCANLGFKPKLAFHLFGGTKRGKHPKLRAVLRYPKKGAYANIARASVALPHSEFLDQGHLKNICTRVQFTANACPAASVYGHAVAKTPLFDTPLEGPVYLRSSSHKLPDLVAALRGPASQPIEVDLDGRIDSINGGIRNTFEVVPDAPVSEFILSMQGGKKGLLQNSTNLCAKTNRATAIFTAQNGKVLTLHPAMQSAC